MTDADYERTIGTSNGVFASSTSSDWFPGLTDDSDRLFSALWGPPSDLAYRRPKAGVDHTCAAIPGIRDGGDSKFPMHVSHDQDPDNFWSTCLRHRAHAALQRSHSIMPITHA